VRLRTAGAEKAFADDVINGACEVKSVLLNAVIAATLLLLTPAASHAQNAREEIEAVVKDYLATKSEKLLKTILSGITDTVVSGAVGAAALKQQVDAARAHGH